MKFSEWLKRNIPGAERASDPLRTFAANKSFERFLKECDRPGWIMRVGLYCLPQGLDRLGVMEDYCTKFGTGRSKIPFVKTSEWSLDYAGADDPCIRTRKENVRRCNWLRAQMAPYLPKRMRFK